MHAAALAARFHRVHQGCTKGNVAAGKMHQGRQNTAEKLNVANFSCFRGSASIAPYALFEALASSASGRLMRLAAGPGHSGNYASA